MTIQCKFCNQKLKISYDYTHCQRCCAKYYLHPADRSIITLVFYLHLYSIAIDYIGCATDVFKANGTCSPDHLLSLNQTIDLKLKDIKSFIENKLPKYMVFS